MSDREFPKHFDGRRFYNPDAPQARGRVGGIGCQCGYDPGEVASSYARVADKCEARLTVGY
jgi:hypothetical protein